MNLFVQIQHTSRGLSTKRRAMRIALAAVLGSTLVAQAQTVPFACTQGISYLFLGSPTDAYEFNIGTGSLTKKTLSGATGMFNAFGYNQKDNLIYGQINGQSQIVRVDANFTSTALDVNNLTGNNITAAVVGDIDANGIMYLTRGGTPGGTTSDGLNYIYKIDLTKSPLEATILPIKPASTYINDWAVSPIDGNLYSVYSYISATNNTKKLTLYRYTTTGSAAGTRTDLGELTAGPTVTSGATDHPLDYANYGSCFMDKAGDMYIVANTSGYIYRIKSPHTGNLVANYVSTSSQTNQNNTDGARCPTTQVATSGPLPVELTAFTATAAPNRAVRLDWATASELNNAYFEVQRSEDGRVYQTLAKVQGHGTSAQANTYSFTDAAPGSAATYYYRLRQVDADGSFDFSPVQVATLAAGSSPVQVAVAPNPSPAGRLHVQVQYAGTAGAAATLTLYSLLGQPVRSQPVVLQPGANSLSLDAAVAPGTYWLAVSGVGGSRQSVRVLLTE